MALPRGMARPLLRLPILTLVILTRLRWRLNELATRLLGRPPAAAMPHHQCRVEGGFWFRQSPCNPFSSHYFTPPERQALAQILRQSDGREALLSSHVIPQGWLLKTWSGLIVLGPDRSACEQTSCGSGDRLAVAPYPRHLSDCFIALQRNDQNYAHFLCEVTCSLLAWEDHLRGVPALAIAAPFGGEILRLCGFDHPIVVVPPQSLLRVRNVEVFSMLPGGYVNGPLLQELRRRVTLALNDRDDAPSNSADVVFLNRSGSDHRQLANWREAAALVKRRFPQMQMIVPGTLPFAEQVRRLASARVVISTQGAHGANLLWARRLEHYIELTANGDGYVAAMATALGATVHLCVGEPLSGDRSALNYDQLLFSDHVADLERLAAVLRTL